MKAECNSSKCITLNENLKTNQQSEDSDANSFACNNKPILSKINPTSNRKSFIISDPNQLKTMKRHKNFKLTTLSTSSQNMSSSRSISNSEFSEFFNAFLSHSRLPSSTKTISSINAIPSTKMRKASTFAQVQRSVESSFSSNS